MLYMIQFVHGGGGAEVQMDLNFCVHSQSRSVLGEGCGGGTALKLSSTLKVR